MANGIRKLDDDEWLREQIAISKRMNKEHVRAFDRSFLGVMAKAGADGDEIAKAHQHRGPHELAASLVQHLHDRLDRHRERHGYTKSAKKEEPMDTLTAIMKDGSVTGVCAAIVAKGSTTITEHELVDAVGKIAVGRYSGLSEAQAFSRVLTASTDEARALRDALKIAKSAEFSVFDISPVVVGATHAQDVDNATAAVRATEEIQRIGREKFPFLSADQQFARIFEDKNYEGLARQAHSRPRPTTIYRPPASQGTAYTKSADPAPNTDTAYAALMAKAEQLRSERPELSVAQCFEKIYTDRANIELAKRERIESSRR
jgi:hypothetical protein